MTTYNISITSTWVQIAIDSNSELLVTWDSPIPVEFASTSTNTAPTVQGHELTREQALTRSVLGGGYVWARTKNNAITAVTLIVSK